jgi:hypothetical protein
VSRPTHHIRYSRHAAAVLHAGVAATVLAGVCAAVVAAHESGPPATGPAGARLSLSAAYLAPPPSATPSASGSPDALQAGAQQAAAQQVVATAAAQRAAAKAAAQRAATQRQAAAERAARSAVRDPRSAARLMLADHSWSSGQFQCLDALWSKESGWDQQARNASGAFGIPQALPGGKMSSAGADWQTNPVTQIRWGLQYIHDVYGSPCAAWAHSRAANWY